MDRRDGLSQKIRLTLVVGKEDVHGKDLMEVVVRAFKGGATALQLREKTLSDREFYEEAQALGKLAKEFGKLFIINNRLDIALAVDADGVHLGEGDLPLPAATKILPKGKILGYSASTQEKAEAAILEGADYLGVGAIYPSPSKPEAPVLSGDAVKSIVTLGYPTVGIGGITTSNAGQAWGMGFTGLAVISAIAGSEDPEGAARGLLSARG
jgi:thiamine-phosphate pyrophosphorylase